MLGHVRIGGVLVLVLAFGLGACDALDDLDNFDVSVKSQTTIQGASPLDMLLGEFPAFSGLSSFDLSQNATFQNKEYGPDDVDSVHLEALKLRTVDPTGQDLAFLGTVVFHIETAGLPRIEIARQETFPSGQTEVAFSVTDVDLKPYVLAKEATVTTEVTDSQRPPQDTVLEVEATFDVDIRVL